MKRAAVFVLLILLALLVKMFFAIKREDIQDVVKLATTGGRMDNNPIVFNEKEIEDILDNKPKRDFDYDNFQEVKSRRELALGV